MTDVQVSNARRIGFTALALIAFWVLAWRAYWIGCEEWYDASGQFYFSWLPWLVATLIGLSFSLVPVGFLSLSAHNSPTRIIRDRSIWCVGLVLVCALGFSYRLGPHDADTGFNAYLLGTPNPVSTSAFAPVTAAARQAHEVSWLSLLLPIILTTAFVIFGAWRRAVRDGEVEVVGEGE